MNNTIKLTGLALVLLFTQCGNNGGGESMNFSSEMAPAADRKMAATEEAQQGYTGDTPNTIERKLIREGHMRFKTESTGKTRVFLDSIVASYGGYVFNENMYKNEGTVEQSVAVRIPDEKFDAFMGSISSYAGKLESKNVNSIDVTEEYMDVETRLKTKKELEARYLDLLKQAKTVTDMVAIEAQLGQVRSEIESMQGRMNYLQSRVKFATLWINFYQTDVEGFGFWDKIGGGWGAGWTKFLSFMVWTVELWPFVLIILTIVIILRIRRRRRNI
ncbi:MULTISPECIES: DUF4349 domain-containing protein [unclassified Imperialibacter]|uniref:DUF4349 domain-containing protein n=1 Tax=unclassified Imperialibacter TaxID=2629706 RepID=UPI0012527636|nr:MULTISPECIES: DUF4349 domain-containing protein [unclassified Imperialibacter]CAD5250586.1 conserved hypothetical protein [Imperialibacter sp. 75]CAD5286471.1 conserved hypothetical protein [Imperialibacter sp. 89]VVT05577.1 conserved hypothetical protein [Imperialibacter sp. EC-SDR9]